MIIGNEATLSTSLSILNNDRFEIANLRNKTLILISDTPSYLDELPTVNALTGGDSAPIRLKHLNSHGSLQYTGEL